MIGPVIVLDESPFLREIFGLALHGRNLLIRDPAVPRDAVFYQLVFGSRGNQQSGVGYRLSIQLLPGGSPEREPPTFALDRSRAFPYTG